MQEQLGLANHNIKTGAPMGESLLLSIASLDRALKREHHRSAPVPTWQRRLKRHIDKLEELKEMKKAEKLE